MKTILITSTIIMESYLIMNKEHNEKCCVAKMAKEVQSLIPQNDNLAHLEVKREINIRITSVGR